MIVAIHVLPLKLSNPAPSSASASTTVAPAADRPKVLASHMPSLNAVKNEEGESGI